MSSPQKALETLCLRVCRDFLWAIVPLIVIPPGSTGNYTDYWILTRRAFHKAGNSLSAKDQRRLLKDRTGENMRSLPFMWALFDSFLVSVLKVQGSQLVLMSVVESTLVCGHTQQGLHTIIIQRGLSWWYQLHMALRIPLSGSGGRIASSDQSPTKSR